MSQRTCGAAGLTLVELLVALAISGALIIAGLRVHAHGLTTYRAAVAVASLQEAGRYALAALAYDIEHAGFWGRTNRADLILGRRSQPSLPAIVVHNDCDSGWAIDLDAAIAATSNRYAWSCRPYRDAFADGSDTLTVRHAEVDPAELEEPGRLYVRTSRFGHGDLYVGPGTPTGTGPPAARRHALVTRGYYVSVTSSLSTARNRVPSLRVKTLTRGPAGPRIVDEEVYPGIEDLQLELGIDTDRPGTAGYDVIDGYVDPESPLPPHTRILAVRIWLLVRALEHETAFVESRARRYADRARPAADDGYRRALVSTTVLARNRPGA